MRQYVNYTTLAACGLGLVIGAAGAHAQTLPYAGPVPEPFAVEPAPGTPISPATSWHVCLNRTFGAGYGSPEYALTCAPEGTWTAPWSIRDPYSWYRPYSDNVGPKPSI